MKLLALDTATDACTVALLIDAEVLARGVIEPRGHAQRILPLVDELLAEAGLPLAALDALAFGRGPGSFTGLRIAAGIVQGLAFGADLPVVPVSDLAALAHGAWRETGHDRVLAALDARMGEVYWGAFHVAARGKAAPQDREYVCPPGEVPQPQGEGWFGAGPGWAVWSEMLRERLGSAVTAWDGARLPHAHDIALLAATAFARGETVAAEQALPVYLREEVAWKKAGD